MTARIIRTAALILGLTAFNAEAGDYRKHRQDAREFRAQARYMRALSHMLSLQGPNTGARDVHPGLIPPNNCGMAFEVVNVKTGEERCAGR
jgi:hypothetical protein